MQKQLLFNTPEKTALLHGAILKTLLAGLNGFTPVYSAIS